MKLEIGNTVCIIGGGPNMTVVDVCDDESVVCIWTVNDKIYSNLFKNDTLSLILSPINSNSKKNENLLVDVEIIESI